jgi:hypothetical protein
MSPPLRPPAAPPAVRPRVSPGLAALALTLLLGLQPVTTDVYLPALPMLTRELAAPMSSAQLTMSALILAFGVAQLFWGPVADRVGRRPVLITGLLLYSAASIGSVLAGSIGWLVLWRVLQGATMAAALTLDCAQMVRPVASPVMAMASATTHRALILDDAPDSLLLRVHMIRAARRSIDLQTYIFDEDDSAQLVLDELQAAAFRGVRVRILLDQRSALKKVETLAAMASLPGQANSSGLPGDSLSAVMRACSRPPLPVTRIFMEQDV